MPEEVDKSVQIYQLINRCDTRSRNPLESLPQQIYTDEQVNNMANG